jgi:hypothetical protein
MVENEMLKLAVEITKAYASSGQAYGPPQDILEKVCLMIKKLNDNP